MAFADFPFVTGRFTPTTGGRSLATPRLSSPLPFDVPQEASDPYLDLMLSQYLQPPPEPGEPLPEKRSTVTGRLNPYPTNAPAAPAPYMATWKNLAVSNAVNKRYNEANAGIFDKQMKQYNSNLKSIEGASTPTGGQGLSAYGFTGRTGTPGTKGSAYMGFQPEFWSRLSAAFNDMARAGLGKPGITDGWRSYTQQIAVKAKKGNLAATPGRSIHGLGLAADLDLNPAQQKWLEANASRYGIHRLASESWHWQADPGIVKWKWPR